jgi:hypothetical protein
MTITLISSCIIPVIKAVWAPKKMLSPVIILVLISHSVKVLIVLLASYLSSLTKVTTPKILIHFKKYSLSAFKKIATSFYGIYLQPNPILLYPSNDNFFIKFW